MDAYQQQLTAHGISNELIYFSERDIRAPSRDTQRERRQKEKYYNYRASNPEMVGRLYYTLTMTKQTEEEEINPRKRRRCNNKGKKSVSATQEEDRGAYNKSSRQQWGWFRMETPELITIAASCADRNHRLSEEPSFELDQLVQSQPLDLALKQYREYSARHREWSPEHYAVSRQFIDNHLSLKVQKWSKRDNFKNRVEFDRYYYIGECHVSRKLDGWEKRWQRAALRNMGRDMKSRSALVQPYKCSAYSWDSFVEEGCYCPCPYCDRYKNADPEFDPRGLEEYLWGWDEECSCNWQDDCTCEWAYEWADYEYEDESLSGNSAHLPDAASPPTSLADWVCYATSESDSEFDLLSSLGDAVSDEEWEQIMSVPDV